MHPPACDVKRSVLITQTCASIFTRMSFLSRPGVWLAHKSPHVVMLNPLNEAFPVQPLAMCVTAESTSQLTEGPSSRQEYRSLAKY